MAQLKEIAQIASQLHLPAVLLDLSTFDRNVRQAVEQVKKLNSKISIRIASKSIRVPALIQRILQADPIFRGIMCYSAMEAKMLVEQGFDDLLIAYPTLQNDDLLAIKSIHEAGKTIYLMTDSLSSIAQISSTLGALSTPLKLVLDIDMSLRFFGGSLHFGVRRSPVRDPDAALEIFKGARDYSNIHLCGLMGYEAQLAGLADENPFHRLMNIAFRWVRKRSISYVKKLRAAVVEKLSLEGFALELVNGGGTGSLNITAGEEALTEVTLGSGFVSSHLFDYYSNISFQPALYFACSVCRQSDPDFATCLGGGYVASGAAGADKLPVAVYPPGVHITEMEGCGEVQTPLHWKSGPGLKPGDLVLFRPAKAGEIAERFNEYHLIDEQLKIQRVKTYRGAGYSFL